MKKILVVNPFGIGDALFTMALVETIRKKSPETIIGFLCNERTEALVRMNVSIDQTFVFNRDLFRRLWRKHPLLFLRKLRGLLEVIKGHGFDTMLDLSLGREYAFFGMLIGISRRVGFDYKGRGLFLTQKAPLSAYADRAVIETQLGLLKYLGLDAGNKAARPSICVPADSRYDLEQFLRQRGIGPQDKILALAPGGGRSWGNNAIYKQWDPDRFASVANQLWRSHRYKVVLLGDASERDLLQKTSLFLEAPKILFCGEDFHRVCALVLRSGLFLGNDGGLLHLADALGAKTVSIYGPVDERVYGPYWGASARAVVTESVPCRPCYKNFHFPPCPYERRCLTQISAEKVYAAVKNIA